VKRRTSEHIKKKIFSPFLQLSDSPIHVSLRPHLPFRYLRIQRLPDGFQEVFLCGEGETIEVDLVVDPCFGNHYDFKLPSLLGKIKCVDGLC